MNATHLGSCLTQLVFWSGFRKAFVASGSWHSNGGKKKNGFLHGKNFYTTLLCFTDYVTVFIFYLRLRGQITYVYILVSESKQKYL